MINSLMTCLALDRLQKSDGRTRKQTLEQVIFGQKETASVALPKYCTEVDRVVVRLVIYTT